MTLITGQRASTGVLRTGEWRTRNDRQAVDGRCEGRGARLEYINYIWDKLIRG